ncbi:spore germination protein [Irregularibacter muris]|uniref:Spore germination protein n=1 Tax=Irregularibacter muris TaxID=1796619 RepID=A0AAE3KYH9_9FIRM|nr:spore germination protein [Irregularibacter muris]MCR1897510.1 spore germination protein [Irregularibacter muris]
MIFRYIIRKIAAAQNRNQFNHEAQLQEEKFVISKNLKQNLDFIKSSLGESNDIKIHEFVFGKRQFLGALIFIDGLVNSNQITESILKPLISEKEMHLSLEDDSIIDEIRKSVLCSGSVTESHFFNEIFDGCLSGDTVMLLDGFSEALIIDTQMWDKRNVTEPQTESVVRGPREGFTENFRTNTSLLRRRIKSPRFRMENMIIGHKTATNICIAYIEGVARPEIIELLKTRLNNINVDSILDSGYIEEYIEESSFSIFPTVGYSEKPDVIASKILEGRIAIISDGSPFVLTVPMLFIESFQTAEDYYGRTIYASITRLMRIFCFFIAIFAVPGFIAFSTFHQELIPTTLLFTIANAREGTPFPALFEALIMVTSFEILKEAGLRLPRPVGQAISIVGALVMGDAAVSAGLVGAPMVITVAITAVASFVIPTQTDSISVLRIIMMILASVLGGFGIAIGFLGMLVQLAKMTSFGMPYFEAVMFSRDQQDSFIRVPLWIMRKRPKNMASEDKKRRDSTIPPVQPYENISQEGKDLFDE